MHLSLFNSPTSLSLSLSPKTPWKQTHQHPYQPPKPTN